MKKCYERNAVLIKTEKLIWTGNNALCIPFICEYPLAIKSHEKECSETTLKTKIQRRKRNKQMDSLKKREKREPEPVAHKKQAYSPCWNASNNGLLSHLCYVTENQICTVPLHPDCGKNTTVPCKCRWVGIAQVHPLCTALHTYSAGSRVYCIWMGVSQLSPDPFMHLNL